MFHKKLARSIEEGWEDVKDSASDTWRDTKKVARGFGDINVKKQFEGAAEEFGAMYLGIGQTAEEKRKAERKRRDKVRADYRQTAGYKRPEEAEYAEEAGFLTEDATTLEEAGLEDSRLLQKAKELHEISEGRAPMQPWEKDYRDRLNQASRRLYAGAGLGGGNRAAQQRAIQMGLAQKSGDVENAILRAREQEQRVAKEELDNLLIMARSAGKGAALALANQHQQWLIAQDQRNADQLSGLIGGLATLAGVLIMA